MSCLREDAPHPTPWLRRWIPACAGMTNPRMIQTLESLCSLIGRCRYRPAHVMPARGRAASTPLAAKMDSRLRGNDQPTDDPDFGIALLIDWAMSLSPRTCHACARTRRIHPLGCEDGFPPARE